MFTVPNEEEQMGRGWREEKEVEVGEDIFAHLGGGDCLGKKII